MAIENTIQELTRIIDEYVPVFSQISDGDFELKRDAKKWSKKEVLGHLVDSAHNNYRRFISGQYETSPKIFYEQDFWVTVNDYQSMNTADLISLWRIINHRICIVLSNTTEDRLTKLVDTGKDRKSLHSIEWLAEDYVKHLKHHINQIEPKSFDIVYP
jgi:hypothetical protein